MFKEVHQTGVFVEQRLKD